ncbi:hypothetical protein PYCC9005_004212 [Savitreella phatthalungensis]
MVIVDAAAGLLAGASSTMLLHPLDLAKTRMQINGGGKTLDVVRQSYREGRLRGVYRGLGTNLIGGAAGWGFYFAWYGQIKRWVAGPSRERLSGTEYLLSAAAAGLLTSACTNPIWVIKTRMLNTAVTANGAYQSFSDGLTKIAAEEGMRGLWRGLVPSLLGVAHGSVQFGLYEMMKDQKKNMAGVLSQLDVLKLSAVSKLGCAISHAMATPRYGVRYIEMHSTRRLD